MASAQRVPMLDLRIAMSEARLGLRFGGADKAAGRLRSALSIIAEPDFSADLVDAEKLFRGSRRKIVTDGSTYSFAT